MQVELAIKINVLVMLTCTYILHFKWNDYVVYADKQINEVANSI